MIPVGTGAALFPFRRVFVPKQLHDRALVSVVLAEGCAAERLAKLPPEASSAHDTPAQQQVWPLHTHTVLTMAPWRCNVDVLQVGLVS